MTIPTAPKTIQLTSLSGKNFLLTINIHAMTSVRGIHFYPSLMAFSVKVTKEIVQDKICIVVSSYDTKKSTVEKDFGVKIQKNSRASIAISENQSAEIDAIVAQLSEPFKIKDAEIREAIKKEEDAMPQKLAYAYSLYYGDYSTEETSEIKIVRKLTNSEEEDERGSYLDPNKIKQAFKHVRDLSKALPTGLAEEIKSRPSIGHQGGLTLYEITPSEAEVLTLEWKQWHREQEQKKAEAAAEKQRQQEEKEKAQKAEKEQIEQNELFIFDQGQIYSSAGNKMLHSLGATFSESKISIYTTAYSKNIPGANTTYSLKDILLSEGFTFDPIAKHWDIANTEENAHKVIILLKKHDSKLWPNEAGLVRCWECGSYFRAKKGDWDGPGFYCGC